MGACACHAHHSVATGSPSHQHVFYQLSTTIGPRVAPERLAQCFFDRASGPACAVYGVEYTTWEALSRNCSVWSIRVRPYRRYEVLGPSHSCSPLSSHIAITTTESESTTQAAALARHARWSHEQICNSIANCPVRQPTTMSGVRSESKTCLPSPESHHRSRLLAAQGPTQRAGAPEPADHSICTCTKEADEVVRRALISTDFVQRRHRDPGQIGAHPGSSSLPFDLKA